MRNDIEFISADRWGAHWHFANEVLHINPQADFPWRLLSVWEWAAEAEANAIWAEGWDDPTGVK